MSPRRFRSPEGLLSELGISDPEDIDLTAIAFFCGATVIEQALRGCEARLVGTDDRAFITVNRGSRRERQRFSIGHELGHWMHDRGTVAVECGKQEFVGSWGRISTEQRANRYAADLLLPRAMFIPRAAKLPVTFSTVKDLASTFATSLTSTAIRLVEWGSFPSMVTCVGAQGVRWAVRNKDLPFPVRLREAPTSDSLAYDILRGRPAEGPMDVAAAAWFEDPEAKRYTVREDSKKVLENVLTLLSWPDEAHLLAYS